MIIHAIVTATRKDGSVARFVRSILDAHERLYVAAITDERTGRIDPALERQMLIALASK